jgi:hypothetical protein
MAESDSADGRDTYSIEQAAISVVCKPKIIYSSSATNWSNDCYVDRIRYTEEHEVVGTGKTLPKACLVTSHLCKRFISTIFDV